MNLFVFLFVNCIVIDIITINYDINIGSDKYSMGIVDHTQYIVIFLNNS